MMDPLVKEECFRIISEEIVSDQWKKLGNKLGLTDPELNGISTDRRLKGEGSEDIYRAMLVKWEQKFPLKVNAEFLATALEKSDRFDLAQKIKRTANNRNFQSSPIQNVQPEILPSATPENASDTVKGNFQNQKIAHNTSFKENFENQKISYNSSRRENLENQKVSQNISSKENQNQNLEKQKIADNTSSFKNQGFIQVFMDKLYIAVLMFIVIPILVYFGNNSVHEYLQGIAEAIHTFGSIRAIGYGFGKLLCLW